MSTEIKGVATLLGTSQMSARLIGHLILMRISQSSVPILSITPTDIKI